MQVTAKNKILSYGIENITPEDMDLLRKALVRARRFHVAESARTNVAGDISGHKDHMDKATKYDYLIINLSDASAVYS